MLLQQQCQQFALAGLTAFHGDVGGKEGLCAAGKQVRGGVDVDGDEELGTVPVGDVTALLQREGGVLFACVNHLDAADVLLHQTP